MKYKDNKFLKFQDRQRDGVESYFTSKSDRQVRREKDHRLSVFYSKHLSKRVEKEWWVCLSLKNKEDIEKSYYNQEHMLGEEMDMWANFEFFDTWEEWFEYIHAEYKPDRVRYRESKLKKLGI
jgi:hypothetical protein